MKPLLVSGIGELVAIAAYCFEAELGLRIAAFTVDGTHLKEPIFLQRAEVPFLKNLPRDTLKRRINFLCHCWLFAGQRPARAKMRWRSNYIGHHATIGDFAFISSHAVVSGGVGARTFVDVNAMLNDHIALGARCVIGSSALVVKDLADESVVPT